MPPHALHTAEILEALPEHILYEVKMATWSVHTLHDLEVRRQTRPELQWPFNLALEGFLLHFRNLRDFFMADAATKPTDVVAWELGQAGVERSYGGGVHLGKELKDDLSRRVAHITTHRELRQHYDTAAMALALEGAYVEWMADLAPRWKEDPKLIGAGRLWMFLHQPPVINHGRTMTSSSPMDFTTATFYSPKGS